MLDDYIRQIEYELRTGGAASLDELYDLALAVRAELKLIKENK